MWFLKLISRLPLWVLYLKADFLYLFIAYILRYRRKVALQNIQKAFPDKSDKEHKEILKKFYRHLSDLGMEVVKGITISESEIVKRVRFLNKEIVEAEFDKGYSIIIMASHQGNWEWILQGGSAQLSKPMDAVYKTLSNKFFDKLMISVRSKFDGKPIPMDKVFREIISRRSVQRGFVMVADQAPHRSSPKYWTEFMGLDTPFFTGADRIAVSTNYPAYFVKVLKEKRGYYTVEFVKLSEGPYEKNKHNIVKKYAEECEKVIREQPENWLWTHNRWKYTREKTKAELNHYE
ncbi:lysophospholipid acyltransferase family protein [Sediminitomix flava]|uniref:KDO2-lipid IV(A) lauroyltransferase n=1 Tax=Sediminitomix flava TaxID=379075 RepID=A0A315ZD71_SEDFL|nr:lysophospholipid acyltransferase family protein [Sediminitomix flava]PWJ43069.1 KDO2-lipid IV(A) lauroyltransferase [Sediminitomix flava]